ncbi:hypothetical protein BJ684DRAFT_21332 [Piptocephalis cylindrospora]|uniref:Uncharacterized protein n=1 Tax=Piptocephalis cylindrospora TaxID=1907219 RepID=A0A4P9Y052_9FUNG|nr:hypothetical protein BJ684DRAFT_21332 [Piptocephalis cylindrospora]|eukprot:RKP12105.1 hypothetical protein BJ684DRAFT_21332 [Piptocephalis cylindrospora]
MKFFQIVLLAASSSLVLASNISGPDVDVEEFHADLRTNEIHMEARRLARNPAGHPAYRVPKAESALLDVLASYKECMRRRKNWKKLVATKDHSSTKRDELFSFYKAARQELRDDLLRMRMYAGVDHQDEYKQRAVDGTGDSGLFNI